MTTVDNAHRRLCHALFDALEQGDVAAVDACYAPDMTMWINVSGETISREANLEAVDKGRGLHRRRLYNDRNINTFDDGFVVAVHDPRRRPQRHRGAAVGVPRRRGPRRQDLQPVRVPRHHAVQITGEDEMSEMSEYDVRDLCNEFFDAYQDGRVDVLRRIMSDDCIVWHNVFGRETTRDENLEAYPNSYTGQRRRTYNDRVDQRVR